MLPNGCMDEYTGTKSFAGYSPNVIALAQIGQEYASVPGDLPGADKASISVLPAAPAAMTLAMCGLCCITLLRSKTALQHAHTGIGYAGAYSIALLLYCVKGPVYVDELNTANMIVPDLCRQDECAGGVAARNYIGLLYRISAQGGAQVKSECTSFIFRQYALRQSLIYSGRSHVSLHHSSTHKYLISSESVLCQPMRFNFNVWTNQAYILAQLTRGPP